MVTERRRLIDLDTVDKYSYDENDFVRQVQTAGSEVQQDFVRVYHPETHRSKKFPSCGPRVASLKTRTC